MFQTDTNCLIDYFEAYDGNSNAANILEGWSTTLSDQVLTVTIPEGSQYALQTFQFYLKVHIKTYSGWLDAIDFEGAENSYF